MPIRKRSLEEIAREEDEKVARGQEAEGLERVPGEAVSVGHILSMRLTPEEIALIRERAQADGVEVSEFVRKAVMDAAHRGKEDRPALVREVQAKVKDLSDTVRRL